MHSVDSFLGSSVKMRKIDLRAAAKLQERCLSSKHILNRSILWRKRV